MADPTKEMVAVAMSGGVDSSVTAHLVVQQGHPAVGLSMVIWEKSKCCNLEAQKDAADVAAALGIPFDRFDFVDHFKKKVVDVFLAGYKAGRTPNPCAICNSDFKFEELFQAAEANYGTAILATGHYARVQWDEASGRYQMRTAVDQGKDQTYFLYNLSQAQLARVRFPLGALKKTEVREIARQLGYAVADKPESQDLCFSSDPHAFLAEHLGEEVQAGPIVHLDGRVLGQHKGVPHYTIGQRRGLGVAAEEPLYVIALDPERNRVIVGPQSAAKGELLIAEGVNWLSIAKPTGPIEAQVKIRYRSPAAPAIVTPLEGDRVEVRFLEPQLAITSGQVAVMYDGDLVLGGGLIAEHLMPAYAQSPAAAALA